MSVCADFPAGIDASTNHGVSVNLNIIGSLSIDTWVKLRQPIQNGRSYIYIRDTAGGSGYEVAITRNNIVAGKNTLTFIKGGVALVDSSVDIVNGTPVHIAITWNSVTKDIIFYRNGVAVQTINEANAILDSAGKISYICFPFANSSINGCIFHLNIYNRILSLAEVNYNMNHPNNAIRNGRQLGVSQESWVGGVWKDLSPNAYDGTPTGVVLGSGNNLAGRNVSL